LTPHRLRGRGGPGPSVNDVDNVIAFHRIGVRATTLSVVANVPSSPLPPPHRPYPRSGVWRVRFNKRLAGANSNDFGYLPSFDAVQTGVPQEGMPRAATSIIGRVHGISLSRTRNLSFPVTSIPRQGKTIGSRPLRHRSWPPMNLDPHEPGRPQPDPPRCQRSQKGVRSDMLPGCEPWPDELVEPVPTRREGYWVMARPLRPFETPWS